MQRLPEADVSAFEEHLLVCPSCCVRMERCDAFVQGMRPAAALLRQEAAAAETGARSKLILLSRWPIWVSGLGAIVALLAWVRLAMPSDPLAVVLSSYRGAGAPGELPAPIPAGRLLTLQVELPGLPRHTEYRMEVVDSVGASLFTGTVRPSNDRLSLSVSRRLAAGRYWVRLHETGTHGVLLREYALELRE